MGVGEGESLLLGWRSIGNNYQWIVVDFYNGKLMGSIRSKIKTKPRAKARERPGTMHGMLTCENHFEITDSKTGTLPL